MRTPLTTTTRHLRSSLGGSSVTTRAVVPMVPARPAPLTGLSSDATSVGVASLQSGVAIWSCGSDRVARVVVTWASAGSSSGGTFTIVLKVEGMMCDGCTSRVQAVLEEMEGIGKGNVEVDLAGKKASIQVAAASEAAALEMAPKLSAAVTELGFEAEVKH